MQTKLLSFIDDYFDNTDYDYGYKDQYSSTIEVIISKNIRIYIDVEHIDDFHHVHVNSSCDDIRGRMFKFKSDSSNQFVKDKLNRNLDRFIEQFEGLQYGNG